LLIRSHLRSSRTESGTRSLIHAWGKVGSDEVETLGIAGDGGGEVSLSKLILAV